MVPRYFRGAAPSDFHVGAADIEGEGDYLRGAGCAEGAGGEGVLRGRNQSDGASFDIAHAPKRDDLPGQRFRRVAERGDACFVYGPKSAAKITQRRKERGESQRTRTT